MFIKIWQRYFLQEFLKIFFLCLFGLFALYILIDYSSHGINHFIKKTQYGELINFYFMTFVERMDILMPFSLVVASVKTLTSLNVRNELIALLSSGLPMKRLMRPFVFLGLFFTFILYVNYQFLLPRAYNYINIVKDKYQPDKEIDSGDHHLGTLETEENGTLLYHGYDAHIESFFDVWWIISLDEIWRIKYLEPDIHAPKGRFVDHFKRSSDQQLLLVESFDNHSFPTMHFNSKELKESIILPRHESMSELAKHLPKQLKNLKHYQAETITAFAYRLVMPWLALLSILGPAPWCLRFSRLLPVFMIYLVSMITLVTFYLIMNAALILGENQVFHPLLAILVPFSVYALFFGWNYCQMTRK